MSNFKNRLLIEQSDLDEKIVKLDAFIDGDVFENIEPRQKELLTEQLSIMHAYSNILALQLQLFA